MVARSKLVAYCKSPIEKIEEQGPAEGMYHVEAHNPDRTVVASLYVIVCISSTRAGTSTYPIVKNKNQGLRSEPQPVAQKKKKVTQLSFLLRLSTHVFVGRISAVPVRWR